jgi:hypothetical protein
MIAKDGIAVPQQVAREWGKGKCLPQLLSRPLRGWLGGHIEVQNAANFSGNDRIKLCAISFISQVYDLLTFWRGTALNASSLCFCGAGRGEPAVTAPALFLLQVEVRKGLYTRLSQAGRG